MKPDDTSGGVLRAYGALVANGSLKADASQLDVALRLHILAGLFEGKRPSKSLFSKIFGTKIARPSLSNIRGLYIWGDVGRGKTMLMDLFFGQVQIKEKRRVHFHEFMDELHKSISEFRQDTRRKKKHFDPIVAAVEHVAKDIRLLCFDEFHVTDITNAMLLGRLFEQLFEKGIVVVATSNVMPDGLYKDGLNRELFLPFIGLLKTYCETIELKTDSDYRLEKLSQQPVFCFGRGPHIDATMDKQWQVLVGEQTGIGGEVRVLGRSIVVPEQGMGAARFGFAELCDAPLGPRDYLAISHAYHTLMIDHVPQFDRDNSNAAKRFIQLIDTLYDRGVRLVASFAVALGELSSDKDTGFEFKRTVSRLNEMASADYLAGKGRK